MRSSDEAAKSFMSIPQSGLFPYNNPVHHSSWYEGILWIYAVQNVSGILNADCVAHYERENASEVSKCMFSQFVAPFLNKNKVFALQSVFDAAGMSEQGISANDDAETNAYGQWYADMFVESFVESNATLHGAMLYSCYSHCGEYNDINVSGVLAGTAIQMFYEGRLTQPLLFQNETYPCEGCCFADSVVPSNVTVCKYPNEKCNSSCSS